MDDAERLARCEVALAATRNERDEAREKWMRAQAKLDTVRAQLEQVIGKHNAALALVREVADLKHWVLRDKCAGPGWYAISENRIDNLVQRARALLGDWYDSLDAAVPGAGTMLRNQEDGAQ